MLGFIYGIILIGLSIFTLLSLVPKDKNVMSPLMLSFSLFVAGIISMVKSNDPVFYLALLAILVVQPIVVIIIVSLLDSLSYLRLALPIAILSIAPFLLLMTYGYNIASIVVVTFIYSMLVVKIFHRMRTTGIFLTAIYLFTVLASILTNNALTIWLLEGILFLTSIIVIYVLYEEGKSFKGEYKPFEVKRKLFHLLAFLIFVPTLNIQPILDMVQESLNKSNLGITFTVTAENVVNFSTVVILGSLLPLFLIVEYLRIAKGAVLIPTNLLRKNEEQSLASYIYTISAAFIIALMFPQIILITAIIVGLIADAMAAIAGVYYGKHKITRNRTLEGTIAGFSTAFILTLLLTRNVIASLAVAAATSIFDTLNIYDINDNFIFPLLTAIVLAIFI